VPFAATGIAEPSGPSWGARPAAGRRFSEHLFPISIPFKRSYRGDYDLLADRRRALLGVVETMGVCAGRL
jgi:hypothetical protein